MKRRRCIAVAAVSAIGLSGGAFGQPKQESVVNVDLSNLRADIAKRTYTDVSRIPANVRLPVGVAANVCGVDANTLARQDKSSTPSCQAKNKSQALSEQVQRRLVAQK
jgi:hypothetical protein